MKNRRFQSVIRVAGTREMSAVLQVIYKFLYLYHVTRAELYLPPWEGQERDGEQTLSEEIFLKFSLLRHQV